MPPRMKSIEMQGYKTFANKVLFEFPMPITAIVGPNGSGKSNISDAIRWVLGEQSYSVLRGHRTTDMIFSGSEKKARAGMASVTITFDNSEHWLPIDYEEVAVTRRAYRDGQNEYLLNGQRVRLKDINELLAQSGLSERTYTIIGQGLIDTALSASPEDRRRFFEEAAGIGLFRSRREESLNRLTETQKNLVRITDILSELEPRVRSLERQAKRAEEYNNVSNELKSLLRDWYGYHWHHDQRDMALVKERCAIQERKTNEIRAEFADLDKSLRSKQDQIRDMRLTISEMHKRAAEAHSRIEELTRRGAILDERRNAASAQIQSAREESASLDEELQLIDERRGELNSSLDSLKSEAEDAAARKAEYQAELNRLQKELSALKEELRGKRDAQTKAETQLIRLKSRADDLRDRTESVEKTLPELRSKLERLEQSQRNFQAENQIFYDTQKQNEEKLAAAVSEIAGIEDELTRKDALLRELRQVKNGLDAELSKVAARLDVLNDAEKNFSGMNQGARFVAQSAKNGKIKRGVRVLQSLLIVPKEYETAAAAALGDELDAVLLDTSEWDNAMDLLTASQSGRAVFLPDSADAPAADDASELPGVTPLMDVIQCPDDIRPVTERLLRGTYLAESRGRALELRAKLRPDQRIVTPSGDLFRGDGSAVSGSEGRQKLLSRTREIREMNESMTALREQQTASANDITAAEKELANLRGRQKEKTADRAKLQTAVNEMQKKLNQLAIEKEKLAQSVNFQKQRVQDASVQLEQYKKQSDEAAGQIAAAEADRDKFRAECREVQDRVNRVQLTDLQDQVQHWNVSCAVLAKSISETETRLRENDDDRLKNEKKQKQLEDRVYAAEKSVTEMDEELAEIRDEGAEAAQAAADIAGETAPAEAALKNAEEKLRLAQENSRSYQQRVVSAERMLAQAQLEVTRQDDRLESLKKRIEDDLGLVNFMYDENVIGQNTLPLGTMAADLPQIEILSEDLEEQIQRRKNHLRRLGSVNTEALTEYKDAVERYEYLTAQMDDLKKADADLRQVIAELDRMMETAFLKTFDRVQEEFKQMFVRLFGGGSARLALTDPEDVNASGIEIAAKLPGHREQELSLLSGGERSLTSVALIFALLRVSPTPFCVMDEVDAALDEANVGRFCELLKELSAGTQFLVITHNRNTVEASNVIYGITMSSDSTSKAVSLRLDEIRKDYLR